MSKMSKVIWPVLIFALASTVLISVNLLYKTPLTYAQSSGSDQTVSGLVLNDTGPVAGAIVRVQLSLESTLTAADGSFTLTGLAHGQPVTVTAWAAGHYIGMNTGVVGGEPVTITLYPHFMTDNHLFEWASSDGVSGSASCGLCHTANVEWEADAHSQSATNPRFLSMYAGTDIHGNKSPDPEKTSLGIPLAPDLTQPYYGPGHALDYPNRPGNCAACHTPIAAKIPNKQNCAWSGCHATTTVAKSYGILDYGPFPIDLKGAAAEGISCEFCHKIGDVILNRETKLPYADMPGILSVRLYRPKDGQNIFFGSLDDVHPSEIGKNRDTYLPLMEESAFCASCHYGIMGGVVGNMQVTGGVLVYSSYSEWLESPYSNPVTGQTCQNCHMPVVETEAETNYFVFPDQGGLARHPSQISSHKMLGIEDESFMQNSVSMTTTAKVVGDQVLVNVRITNDRVGHHIPTDSPLRHMMLVVEAKDASGQLLSLTAGSTLPDWAGNYANHPGKMFAKLLQDEWTGEMPTGAYWRPVRLVSDTRLPALKTSASYYQFAIPAENADADVIVEARLIFRRAYQQLQEWKDWNDPDMLMKEEIVRLSK